MAQRVERYIFNPVLNERHKAYWVRVERVARFFFFFSILSSFTFVLHIFVRVAEFFGAKMSPRDRMTVPFINR